MRKSLRQRFEERWVLNPATGCHPWTGCRYKNGYGKLSAYGKNRYAHRLSYAFHNGDIPDGLRVCHTCDVNRCVNPAHLFLGTAQDNSSYMCRKGRQAYGDRSPMRIHPESISKGELNGQAKITEDIVRQIRCRYKRGNGASLGREFGIAFQTVSSIVNGKTWKHVL